MLDSTSKTVLKYLSDNYSADDLISLGSFISKYSQVLDMPPEHLRSIIRFLESEGFVYFMYSETGQPWAFRLTYKCLGWKSFKKLRFVDYVADKWIDILALLFSAAAVVISIISLSSK